MAHHSRDDDPQRRENPDPQESLNPAPVLLLAMMALLFTWAMYYIRTARPNTPPDLGDRRTVSVLTAAPVKAVDGEQIFAANCSACHQATGTGIPGVFPPLAGSEWVLGKESILVQIILHGINGSIPVKGTTYNGSMPTFKDRLSDVELAAVATFLRSHWGNAADPVTAETVKTQRAATEAKAGPWAGNKELVQLRQD